MQKIVITLIFIFFGVFGCSTPKDSNNLPSEASFTETTNEYVYGNDDIFFLTKKDFSVNPLPVHMTNIKIGKGVYLGNPNYPTTKIEDLLDVPTNTFIEKNIIPPLRNNNDKNTEDGFSQSSTNWFENQSEEVKAQALVFNFGAKFGFGKFDLALSHLKENRHKSHTIIFTRTKELSSSRNIGSITIKEELKSELENINKIPEDDIRLDVFTGRFGSHYVESFTSGYRIAIYGNIETTDDRLIQQFHAHFKSFSYDGSLSAAQSSFFKENSVTLMANLISGELPDKGTVLTTFEDVSKFLAKVKSGELIIPSAPISAQIATFRNYLLAYPNIYSILRQVTGERVRADFGVPAGTIIAWYPKVYGYKEGINIPIGWAICDGNNETPDLREKFIRGTSLFDDTGTGGGSLNHYHSGKTSAGGSRDGGDNDNDIHPSNENHTHTFDTDTKNHLPPYLDMVYIIKKKE